MVLAGLRDGYLWNSEGYPWNPEEYPSFKPASTIFLRYSYVQYSYVSQGLFKGMKLCHTKRDCNAFFVPQCRKKLPIFPMDWVICSCLVYYLNKKAILSSFELIKIKEIDINRFDIYLQTPKEKKEVNGYSANWTINVLQAHRGRFRKPACFLREN